MMMIATTATTTTTTTTTTAAAAATTAMCGAISSDEEIQSSRENEWSMGMMTMRSSKEMKSEMKCEMKEMNHEEMVRKGPWMPEEDEILIEYVREFGARDWSSIRSKGLLPRTGKSCRLRWVNKLKPDLKRSGCKFSPEEEKLVVEMQSKLGNKWAKIASSLPGRTDNDVKNFWSTRQKRLMRSLHRPKLLTIPDVTSLSLPADTSPTGLLPSSFTSPFYLGDEEEHNSSFNTVMSDDCCRIQSHDELLHTFNDADLDNILTMRLQQHHSNNDTNFISDNHYHQPVRSTKRRSKKRPMEEPEPEILPDLNTSSSSLLPVKTIAGSEVAAVNLFEDDTDFQSILPQHQHHDEHHRPHIFAQELPPLVLTGGSSSSSSSNSNSNYQWNKLPMLYSETQEHNSNCNGNNSHHSKAVDSCSPDSVLASLSADVFDCLEPLCPAPSEWWVGRLT